MGRLAAAALALAAGCATLTPSQVKAVHDFADATNGFEELPPQVLRSYDELRLGGGILQAASVDASLPGVDVFKSISTKVDQSIALGALADELRAALEVLKTYTALLKTLSSDDFSDALEDKSKELGRSLDRATDQYNSHFGSKLPSFAGLAAAAIDAAGAAFLRVRQGQLLKEYVSRADPALPELLARVRAIVGVDLPAERERLQEIYTGLARSRGELEYDEVNAIAMLLRKAHAAEALLASVQGAADNFVSAHHALLEALQQKRDLKGRLEPVLALSDQVKKAAAIKNDYH